MRRGARRWPQPAVSVLRDRSHATESADVQIVIGFLVNTGFITKCERRQSKRTRSCQHGTEAGTTHGIVSADDLSLTRETR